MKRTIGILDLVDWTMRHQTKATLLCRSTFRYLSNITTLNQVNTYKDLPREKVTSLSTDLAGLKKDLKEAAKKETEELKSKIKPNSAHKVYAWRHLLEEKESKSQAVSCVPVPSEVYLPDKTNQLLTVFHKEHITDGKVRNVSEK